jgi:membrane-associated phospholipid phosphatase
MDIQYLLFLQNIRVATGGVFDEFFNALSKVAVELMPFLPFIIFWCVSRKWGYRFLMTLGIADLVNGILKLTVCAYRPWIRSDLIEPAGDSKVAATGYSFPSGHTTEATAVYGTTFAWQRKKRRWLAVLSAVLIALTGFSRNYLGVHTPQDVVVGFASTLVIILLVGFAQRKIDGDDRKLDILTLIGIVVVIGTLIYIKVKPYPMDYVGDTLLVDPNRMMNDTFSACGAFLGLLAGSYVERHYVHYEIPTGAKNLPVLGFVGFLITFAWREYFASATIVAALGGHWGNLIARFILWFFVLAIWPVFIRKWAAE